MGAEARQKDVDGGSGRWVRKLGRRVLMAEVLDEGGSVRRGRKWKAAAAVEGW